MADKAHIETDLKLAEMEKHLSAIYTRTKQEIGKEWAQYMLDVQKHIKGLQSEYDKALLSGDKAKIKRAANALANAKKDKTLRSKRYKDLTNQYANELLHVNETAMAYINGQLPEVYTLNYNSFAGQAEQIGGYSFTLTDADTVANLATSDKTLLPYKTVNGKKDVRWNTKKVNSEVLQGILQGESMQKIANRLEKVESMNKTSAIRNARTSVTSAECKGRQDSYERAQDDGIQIKKRWLATLDGRTRHAHGLLDGQTVDVKKPFKSEFGDIMFPGDPAARPENVYNCRCTTIADVGQARGKSRIARDENGKSVEVENMTYAEWHQWRTGKPFAKVKDTINKVEQKTVETKEYAFNKIKTALGDKFERFKNTIKGKQTEKMFGEFSDSLSSIRKAVNGSYYTSASDTVFFEYEKHKELNEFSIFAHEMGHSFDKRVSEKIKFSFKEVEAINEKCKIGSGTYKTIKPMVSTSDEFLSAMRKDKEKLKVYMTNAKERKEIHDALMQKTNESSGVQDAMDGFFSTSDMLPSSSGWLPWGHGNAYYNRFWNKKIKSFDNASNLKSVYKELGMSVKNQTEAKKISRDYETASELWANITSAYTVGGEELAQMKKFMPNACKEYERIMEELNNAF